MKAHLLIGLLVLFSLLLIGCERPVEESKSPLYSYLEQKFSQSSKATVESVTDNEGILTIQLYSLGIGDIKDVAIDVAIVLNQHMEISFTKINIQYQQEQISFTKEIFDKYRTGQINDIKFMESLYIS